MEYLDIIIELLVALGSVVGVIITAKSNFSKINAELDKRIALLQNDSKSMNGNLQKDIINLNGEISKINNELRKINDTAITIARLEGRINLLEAQINNLRGK